MKIAFIVTFLSTTNPASIYRVTEICKSLEQAGVDVTLMTPFEEEKQYLSPLKIQPIPNRLSRMKVNTMLYSVASKLLWSPMFAKIIFSNSSIDLGLNTIRDGIDTLLRSDKFDIVHAVQPLAALAAMPITKRLGIPLISDLHNISFESAVVDGQAQVNDSLYKRLYEMEKNMILGSTALTVVSDSMRSYIASHFEISTNKQIFVIPCAGSVLQESLTPERKNIVIYAGTVHSREHVDLFAHSIPFVTSSAEYYISNLGPDIKKIKKIASDKKYPKIHYFFFEKRDHVISLLKQSKVGILTSRNDITRQLGPPLKLYDYLSSGTPVVANDVGGWSRLIHDERVGILTDDDPTEFAYAITSLLKDTTLWQKMHQNAINLIKEKYNNNKIVREVLIPGYESITKIP